MTAFGARRSALDSRYRALGQAPGDVQLPFSAACAIKARGPETTVRVLIVEDEAALARQLATALGDAGYVVDCAADGERADFLAQTEQYDLVVLDLGLPRIDGLTLLRRWRDSGLATPVLVLTARGGWHDKVQGIDAGADDYVAKPFRMEEVLARLRALLRRAGGHISNQLRSGAVTLDARGARDARRTAGEAHEP